MIEGTDTFIVFFCTCEVLLDWTIVIASIIRSAWVSQIAWEFKDFSITTNLCTIFFIILRNLHKANRENGCTLNLSKNIIRMSFVNEIVVDICVGGIKSQYKWTTRHVFICFEANIKIICNRLIENTENSNLSWESKYLFQFTLC